MTSLPERFWSKVDKTSSPDGCWLWTASIRNDGYGQIAWRPGPPKKAHRLAYIDAYGPIPDGLELDHRCRVRACCNPEHLEAVTHRENLARSPITLGAIGAAKTHCPQGHEYTEANTYLTKMNRRICRTCNAFYSKRAADRRKVSVV